MTLLSTAKAENFGGSAIIFPTPNPANTPGAWCKNSFYKFGKKYFGCQQFVHKY